MRLSLRLAASLVASISLLALVFAYFQVRGEKRTLRRDLERRAAVLTEGLKETVEPHIGESPTALQRLVEHLDHPGALVGIVVSSRSGRPIASTPGLEARLAEPVFAVTQANTGSANRASRPGVKAIGRPLRL